MTPQPARQSLRVGIACNIRTDHRSDAQAEFDEPEVIAAIAAALKSGGFESVVLEATEGFPEKLLEQKPDIVFNIAEGVSGRNREAHIPAMLEYYGVPYTGSDVATLSIALDKALAKQIVQCSGVNTPPAFLIRQECPEIPEEPGFPILVKPNAEGSGKGISDNCVARNAAQLRALVDEALGRYGQNLLAEQYVHGREFTVGIVGNGRDMRVFAPMEIIYQKLRGPYRVYSYEMKKNFRDHVAYRCPPDLPQHLQNRLMRDAAAAYSALGCLDFARMDFRMSPQGEVFFIEANPLPGLAPGYSDFPMIAECNGVDYNGLVCGVLGHALKRYGMKADEEYERAE